MTGPCSATTRRATSSPHLNNKRYAAQNDTLREGRANSDPRTGGRRHPTLRWPPPRSRRLPRASSPTRARSQPERKRLPHLQPQDKCRVHRRLDGRGLGRQHRSRGPDDRLEAFVDSAATTPIRSTGLTVTANTDNSAPTVAKASPGATQGNDTGKDANTPARGWIPGSRLPQQLRHPGRQQVQDLRRHPRPHRGARGDRGGGDHQGLHRAQQFDDCAQDQFGDRGGEGTRRRKNATSATADAGNIKFTPDAPTITSPRTEPGSADGGTTYYYKLTSLYKGDDSTNATSTHF